MLPSKYQLANMMSSGAPELRRHRGAKWLGAAVLRWGGEGKRRRVCRGSAQGKRRGKGSGARRRGVAAGARHRGAALGRGGEGRQRRGAT